jgi:hypothetical protein
MTEVYCDIIPQANGWCFLSEEGQSAIYPSYRLAVEAARQYCDQQTTRRSVTVLRQQDLRGRMLTIAAVAEVAGQACTTGAAPSA